MNHDLAGVADQVTILRDRDIPLLWRPLHEFTGHRFWWGKHGPAAFKDLYIHMYDYFTNSRGLTNLILNVIRARLWIALSGRGTDLNKVGRVSDQ